MSNWLNPSGGLVYHSRALLHSRGLWRPFHQSIRAWISDWNPPENHCLLIGPSGGYSLNALSLSAFKAVTVIEPDPVARTIFRARYARRLAARGIRLTALDERLPLPGSRSYTGPGSVTRFFRRHCGSAVLFSNLLGQAHVLSARSANWETAWGEWKAALPEILSERSFATYHDRISGALAPNLAQLAAEGAQPLETNRLGEIAYGRRPIRESEASIELVDHGTEGLFPALPRAYFHWEIRPRNHHLIEGVRSVR